MKTQGQWNRRVDFTKVCRQCTNYEEPKGYPHPVCHAPVDVVTGNAQRVDCRSARSLIGYCGPEGRHFVVREAIEGEAMPLTQEDVEAITQGVREGAEVVHLGKGRKGGKK